MERLAAFRESSLGLLMYRDWGEFEQFSDVLITSRDHMEVRTNLRRFVRFLEVLVTEVSKDSIFQKSGVPSGFPITSPG
jgi:hypothetical protein